MTGTAIPVGWRVALLKDIADLERDSLPPGKIPQEASYVGLEHIDGDTGTAVPSIGRNGEILSSKFQFTPQHILYGKLRPYLSKIARPSFAGVCSTDILPLRPKQLVDRDFLYFYLRQPEMIGRATRLSAGANLPRISPANLENFQIFFPMLAEQKRIAIVLNRADAIRRTAHETLGFAHELRKSAFLEVVGDPVTNPKGWRLSSFGEQLDMIQYGPRFYNQAYSNEGVRIVRITDLSTNGDLDFNAMPKLSVSDADLTNFSLRPGDIIFARSGATVGKIAAIYDSDPQCIAGAYFIRFSLKPSVSSVLARMVLECESIQSIIQESSRQSAQQNFSGPALRRLPLPIPPETVQRRLEEIDARVRAITSHLRQRVYLTEQLFNSLVQQAFRGEL